jgi:hypothetical protein
MSLAQRKYVYSKSPPVTEHSRNLEAPPPAFSSNADNCQEHRPPPGDAFFRCPPDSTDALASSISAPFIVALG